MIDNFIVSIRNSDDIKKISGETKYINITTNNNDRSIVNYFINNGDKYFYSELSTNNMGYIYVPYEIFKNGESIIEKIINEMPSNLSALEKMRYIYIHLGKLLSLDINSMEEKNDIVSLITMENTQNIWGALVKKKITKKTLAILVMYIYSNMGIKCELISNNIGGSIANKVYLDDDNFMIISLADDISNIQGGFRTVYFGNYNDDKDIDRKLGYINNKYMDEILDDVLGKICYTEESMLEEILNKSVEILDINRIGVYELGEIYKKIFKSYCPNYDIGVNNLYVSNDKYQKEHFIVISYSDKMYSFNYNKNYFMLVNSSDLIENIDSSKIGIYKNEEFEIRKREAIL